MPEFTAETIEVGAVFGKNKIKPKWFIRSGHKHDIKEITYLWRSREGDAVIVHFNVTDGANLFEISFNQKSMVWTLDEIQ
ncbi:MAG: hypothetical protein LHV68_00785 [Elusimicrobia bacterium]|nr:hypothetical protein [Candidatus Liberimonas magnetica]